MIKFYLNLARLLCILVLAGVSMPAFSQVLDTTDKFVISDLQIDDEGDTYFTVSLSGGDEDRIYCAYNMTITLPLGVTFATDDGMPMIYKNIDGGMYPYTGKGANKEYLHTLSSSLFGDTGREALVICYSGTNADLKATSGALFDVYVVVSPWAKAGANEITLTELNLTTQEDAQKYIPLGDLNTGTIDIPGEDRKVDVNISSANKWGTCILPFAHTPSNGLNAYSISSVAADEVHLTPVAEMEAYKPYILCADDGFTATLTGTAYAADFPNDAIVNVNGLCGSIVAGEASEGYILQNQGEGAMFYQIGSTPFAIKAGKCYLAPVGSGRQMLKIRMDESSIEDITVNDNTDDVYYNISGQQVSNPCTGIYIHNGKKQLKTK